jgi:hypothetical protein
MVASSAPQAGQIIEHYFLWADERAAGLVESRKARPCLIVAVESIAEGRAASCHGAADHEPSTVQWRKRHRNSERHQEPYWSRSAQPAWIVVGEANAFTWPGFDLIPQGDSNFVRGVVTRGFFISVRDAMLSLRTRIVERDE